MPVSERDIHAGIIASFRLGFPPDVVFHHSMNEGKRGWRGQADVKLLGMVTGWPDIEIMHSGCAYFLEVKSEKGRLTANQIAAQHRLHVAGCLIATVRSVDEALATVIGWGLPFDKRYLPHALR